MYSFIHLMTFFKIFTNAMIDDLLKHSTITEDK